MTDEAKLNKQAARGDRAKRILEDELVVEAFDKIEATILDAWKNSPADAEKERNTAYLMHRLLQNFKAQFQLIVTTGDAAGKDLLRLKDPSRFAKIIGR